MCGILNMAKNNKLLPISKSQQEKVHGFITNISDSDGRQAVFVAGRSFIPVNKEDRETADVPTRAIAITTRVIMATLTTTVITAAIVIPSTTKVINDCHVNFSCSVCLQQTILIVAHKEQCDTYQSTLHCEASNGGGDDSHI